MKYTFLTLLILNANIVAYSQAETENVIYKKIIDEFTLKHKQPNIKYFSLTLIVLEIPFYMRKPDIEEFSRFKEKYKKLEKNTFVDFINKNQEGLRIEKTKFPDAQVVLVNQAQSKNRKELLAMYPKWNGSILEFSNIGFNEEKDQAIVYYGFDSGPGVGGGFYIIFEKKKKEWKAKKVLPAWAA